VEIMVAVGIMGLVVGGVLKFALQTMNTYAYDSGRLMVNRDMRTFTGALANDCVASNYFRIYPDFSDRSGFVADGASGDFLILVLTDTNNAAGSFFITQLVGYYRDANPTDPTSLGPVRRVSKLIAAADQGKDLPTLIAQYMPVTTTHTDPVVIQLAQGLSSGSLFYDYRDRSIMVRGQIVDYGSKGGRAAINTYNFTVSPRG
jgi:hypothetical protein